VETNFRALGVRIAGAIVVLIGAWFMFWWIWPGLARWEYMGIGGTKVDRLTQTVYEWGDGPRGLDYYEVHEHAAWLNDQVEAANASARTAQPGIGAGSTPAQTQPAPQ